MTRRKQLPPHRVHRPAPSDQEFVIAERVTADGVRWQVRCPKCSDPDDVCDYVRIVWYDPDSDITTAPQEHEQDYWRIEDWRDDPYGQGMFRLLLNIKVMLNR